MGTSGYDWIVGGLALFVVGVILEMWARWRNRSSRRMQIGAKDCPPEIRKAYEGWKSSEAPRRPNPKGSEDGET